MSGVHLLAERMGEEKGVGEESLDAARIRAAAVPCPGDDELLHHLLCLVRVRGGLGLGLS